MEQIRANDLLGERAKRRLHIMSALEAGEGGVVVFRLDAGGFAAYQLGARAVRRRAHQCWGVACIARGAAMRGPLRTTLSEFQFTHRCSPGYRSAAPLSVRACGFLPSAHPSAAVWPRRAR